MVLYLILSDVFRIFYNSETLIPSTLQCRGGFFPIFGAFLGLSSLIAQMASADGYIHSYMHYISAILEEPLRVSASAKMTEIVQQLEGQLS